MPACRCGRRAFQAADLEGEGYWSKRLEHHVVFYTFTDAELRIRRVLHEVLDVGRHL